MKTTEGTAEAGIGPENGIGVNHDEQHSQPDQEPSVVSGETPVEVPENDNIIDLTLIPIPSSDSESAHELFYGKKNISVFNCSADQVWKIEIDITQKDIDNWREESQPSCMAFVVSAAKKQRAEVKLSELTDSDRKLFRRGKRKRNRLMDIHRHRSQDIETQNSSRKYYAMSLGS